MEVFMRSSKYALLLAGCLATSAYAADPNQAEDQNPPEPQLQQVQPPQPERERAQRFFDEARRGFRHVRPMQIEMRKGAYLGVSTSPASPVLQRQLGLPEGMGLVVEFVAPKSPAEEAGMRQYDVMQKINDQL